MGFSSLDASFVFLWQGLIVLIIYFSGSVRALATYTISSIPLRIRGFFQRIVCGKLGLLPLYMGYSYCRSFVLIASWIPARRAGGIEPAKIIRETM